MNKKLQHNKSHSSGSGSNGKGRRKGADKDSKEALAAAIAEVELERAREFAASLVRQFSGEEVRAMVCNRNPAFAKKMKKMEQQQQQQPSSVSSGDGDGDGEREGEDGQKETLTVMLVNDIRRQDATVRSDTNNNNNGYDDDDNGGGGSSSGGNDGQDDGTIQLTALLQLYGVSADGTVDMSRVTINNQAQQPSM